MKKKIVGKRITEARVKAGISTSTLASHVGKSQATISRIENGKQNISLRFLVHIAKALDVHPFYLLETTGMLKKPESSLASCFEQVMTAARIESQLSTRAVGLKIDRPQRYIEDIENGLIIPDINELESFSDLYNLNIELLTELYNADIYCPKISKRFAEVAETLLDCLDILRSINDKSPIFPNDLGVNAEKFSTLLRYFDNIDDQSSHALLNILINKVI